MPKIERSVLPQGSWLHQYAQSGAYTDCYIVDVPGSISLADFVEAFYTSALFKVERSLLSRLISKPSTDAQAKQLAHGNTVNFAAWSVERRSDQQLLLRDFLGRTRSWLMSVGADDQERPLTRLYFGTAVVPKGVTSSGRPSFGWAFHALYGFHQAYAQALLQSTLTRLPKVR